MKIILESIEEINEFYENWNGARNVHADEIEMETEHVDDSQVTYRRYAKSTIEKIPLLDDVDEHGNLKMRTQKTNIYKIYDLLELKRKIPQRDKFPTWGALSDAVGLNIHTAQRLSAGIELGYYEHLFIKWDSFAVKYDEMGQLI